MTFQDIRKVTIRKAISERPRLKLEVVDENVLAYFVAFPIIIYICSYIYRITDFLGF